MPLKRPLPPLLLPIAVVACGPQPADVVVHLPGPQTAPAIADPAPSGGPATEPPDRAASIAWETDDAAARERAKARGVPLLVFVTADWSAPDARMDRETWSDPRVIRRARSFVALRLDVSKADANAQVDADRYDVQRVPSTVILDELGHEITRIDGYARPEDVLSAMSRVLPGN